MQVRILAFSDNYEGYRIKSYVNMSNISELVKILHYMQNNDIPITINTEDVVDTDGEEYYIDSFTMVLPKCGGATLPYIAVFVQEI